MTTRERLEQIEQKTLSPHAQLSSQSRGRALAEPEDELRPCFQRDRDRILHAKSFRRLAHKTQVFLAPEGDHYRTRITHTMEVAQVARTITRCLGLNEELTEAMAMGHDLGHTPFGHAGESVLAHMAPGGFHHAKQSLRVVEQLEKDGRGLNLTVEVRDGILKHSKGKGPILSDHANAAITLEGQIVRIADIVAYVNHDLDDAMRAGLIAPGELPTNVKRVLGETHAERLRGLIVGVVDATDLEKERRMRMHDDALGALVELRDFLYQRVYEKDLIRGEFEKAQRILGELWTHFHEHADEFRAKWWPKGTREEEGLDRAVTDFIAGMTDRYAIRTYEELRMPRRWWVY